MLFILYLKIYILSNEYFEMSPKVVPTSIATYMVYSLSCNEKTRYCENILRVIAIDEKYIYKKTCSIT